MLGALTAALISVTYSFEPNQVANYKVQMKLDGYLPAFGGIEGTAQANLDIAVRGGEPDADKNDQAIYELKGIKVLFNDAPFPLSLESAKPYFPTTTLSVTPLGKVLKTNAPDIKMPIRLPGLDPKHFPETTFLSVEWPAAGVEQGQTWTTKRILAGSEMTLDMTADKVTNQEIQLSIKLSQDMEMQEDAAKAIPAKPEDAVAKVVTKTRGTGSLTFDRMKGLISRSLIQLSSSSQVTTIKTGEVTNRNLNTEVKLDLQRPSDKAAPAEPASMGGNPPTWAQVKAMSQLYYRLAVTKSTPVVEAAKRYIGELVKSLQAQLIR